MDCRERSSSNFIPFYQALFQGGEGQMHLKDCHQINSVLKREIVKKYNVKQLKKSGRCPKSGTFETIQKRKVMSVEKTIAKCF